MEIMASVNMMPSFEDLIALRGASTLDDAMVSFYGNDPVVQSRFKVGEVSSAAMVANAVAANDIWQLRNNGGVPQKIRIDKKAAAASLRSYAHLEIEGKPPLATGWTEPTVSYYRCRDGRFLHLQGTFPHQRDQTLKFLACNNSIEEIAAKIILRDSFDWEEDLAKERLCGAVIRSREEWLIHPQGRAMRDVPIVEVIKVADGEPEPLSPARRPLSSVRVLDLTRVLAGPIGTRTLAAHGADVLHVRREGLAMIELFAADTNHGKLSTFLDLKLDTDANCLRSLARDGDIFVQGYRTGVMNRLGFGLEDLLSLRRNIIYVSLNCYGHTGPWVNRPGWEHLAQSVSGLATENGHPGDPKLIPAALCDNVTGYLASYGAMLALKRRMVEGGSYHVRVSLCRTAMWISSQQLCSNESVLGVNEPSVEDIDVQDYRMITETPFGRMHHLNPIVQMSETPLAWERPTVPLGTHEPKWP